MKTKLLNTINGPVFRKDTVLVFLTPEQKTEFIKALDLVNQVKQVAYLEAKYDEKMADLTQVDYRITDEGVEINILGGANG